MNGRNEWKYILSELECQRLYLNLDGLLEKDINANPDGFYSIHSLYFDDKYNTCANDVEAGNSKRHKFRIRYYDKNTNRISLEKKIKINNICYKRSCLIGKKEYDDIINGDIEDYLYDKREVLKELSIETIKYDLKPKIIVDYKRKVYVEELTNTRVTIDLDVGVSRDIDDYLNGTYSLLPIIKDKQRILEVKFDVELPYYIREACEIEELNQISFSKYYMGYEILNGG